MLRKMYAVRKEGVLKDRKVEKKVDWKPRHVMQTNVEDSDLVRAANRHKGQYSGGFQTCNVK